MTSAPPTPPLRVVLAGAGGRLGRRLVSALGDAPDLQLVAGLTREDDGPGRLGGCGADVLLDVSLASASRELVPAALRAGLGVVVGVSGLTDQDREGFDVVARSSGRPVLLVPNFSVGAVLQMEAAARAAALLAGGTIHEVHHSGKLDAPSGTALATAARMERASGGSRVTISSERRDDVVARQTVSFSSASERYELRHEVLDRSAFVPGALLAVRGVMDLPPGLAIGLEAVLCTDEQRPSMIPGRRPEWRNR